MLRYGELGYFSPTTFIAGGVPTITNPKRSEMMYSLFEEGFFQRIWLVYKDLSDREYSEIDNELERIKNLDYLTEIVPKEKAFLQILKRIPWCIENYRTDNKGNHVIGFKKEDIHEMELLRHDLRDQYFIGKFTDRKQSIFISHYGRLNDKLNILAAQRAIYLNKPRVDIEDYRYAVEASKSYCEGLFDLFCEFETMVNDVKRDRENTIIGIIREKPLSQTTLLDKLERFRQSKKWDLSRIPSRNLILRMVEEHKIREIRGDGNKIIYSLAQ